MSFEDGDGRKCHKQYYLPAVEVKAFNILIDGRNFFDQAIKNDLKTYDNIWKSSTSQGDDYTGCLLNYLYFKKYSKLIGIDLG